jgi:hypothetical protein
MSLKDNLLRPEFSRDREELLNYRLLYEIKKHGLASGVDYELFPPVIDKNGYDLLIKHGRNMKAFQLKTVAKSAKTSYWNINKKFLRPDNLRDGSLILSNFSADLAGLGGGVIIMEYDFDTNSELKLEYYYFDYQILYFFQKGLFRWSINNASYCELVTSIFEEGKKPFKLQKSLLYKTNGIRDLLTISRIEPLNCDLTKENTETWTFGILNFGTGIQSMTIHRNGLQRQLEIYDTSLIRKKMIVGDRVFESSNKTNAHQKNKQILI